MIALLRRLPAAHRPALLALCALGLLAIPLWAGIAAQRSTLQATNRAVASIAPLNSAVGVLQQLQMERALSSTAVEARPEEEAERRPQPGDTRAKLRRLRDELDAAALPDSARRAADIAARHAALGSRPAGGERAGSAAVADRHALVDDQLRLIQRIADEAGLTGLADPAARDVAVAAATDLPQAAEAIARLRLNTPGARPRPDEASAAERAQVHHLLARATLGQQQAIARLQRAGQARPDIGDAVAEALAAARVRGEQALYLVDAGPASEATAPTETRRANATFDAAAAAQRALFDKASGALLAQLQQQAVRQQHELAAGLGGIAAGVLLVVGLALARSRSVDPATAPVRHDPVPRPSDSLPGQRLDAQVAEEIGEVVEAVLAGDPARRLPLEGRQVFHAELCGRINQLLDSVQATLGQVRQVAEPLAVHAGRLRQAVQGLSTAASPREGRTSEAAPVLQAVAGALLTIAEQSRASAAWAAESADRMRESALAVDSSAAAWRSIGALAGDVDDQAYRTQLAALNTLIAAAREASPGDDRVRLADEVRSLAESLQARARELAARVQDSTGEATTAGRQLDVLAPGLERMRERAERMAAAAATHAEALQRLESAQREVDELALRRAATLTDQAVAGERLEIQLGRLLAIAGSPTSASGLPRSAAPIRTLAPSAVDEAAFSPF